MSESSGGCARPTGAMVGEVPTQQNEQHEETKETHVSTATVGSKAPDFTAPAYYQGTFTEVKLSDFLGKWVLLCFYPGDFTFV